MFGRYTLCDYTYVQEVNPLAVPLSRWDSIGQHQPFSYTINELLFTSKNLGRLARTKFSLAWLMADQKFNGGGSCKGSAVLPAYAPSCPDVTWGVLQMWRRLQCDVLYRQRSSNFQKADHLTFLWFREKYGRLEVLRISYMESSVNAINGVHYIVILLLSSWCTP